MRRLVALAGGGLVGLALTVGVAYGADGGSATRTGPAEAPGADLDLSIRARALGIVPESPAAPSLGLEVQRAPTGAGVTRMAPARIDLGSGTYIELRPSCIPGVDDFGPPLYSRSRFPRR